MVTIRALEEGDLPAVSAVYAQSWRQAYQGIVPQGYLDRLENGAWLSVLAERRADSLAAEENGALVGTVCAVPARDERWPGWGEIVALYLLPEYQRRGIGTLLLKAALDCLSGRSFERVYLWAAEGNASARRFYEARGFTLASERTSAVFDSETVWEVRYVRTLGKEERDDHCSAGKPVQRRAAETD